MPPRSSCMTKPNSFPYQPSSANSPSSAFTPSSQNALDSASDGVVRALGISNPKHSWPSENSRSVFDGHTPRNVIFARVIRGSLFIWPANLATISSAPGGRVGNGAGAGLLVGTSLVVGSGAPVGVAVAVGVDVGANGPTSNFLPAIKNPIAPIAIINATTTKSPNTFTGRLS